MNAYWYVAVYFTFYLSFFVVGMSEDELIQNSFIETVTLNSKKARRELIEKSIIAKRAKNEQNPQLILLYDAVTKADTITVKLLLQSEPALVANTSGCKLASKALRDLLITFKEYQQVYSSLSTSLTEQYTIRKRLCDQLKVTTYILEAFEGQALNYPNDYFLLRFVALTNTITYYHDTISELYSYSHCDTTKGNYYQIILSKIYKINSLLTNSLVSLQNLLEKTKPLHTKLFPVNKQDLLLHNALNTTVVPLIPILLKTFKYDDATLYQAIESIKEVASELESTMVTYYDKPKPYWLRNNDIVFKLFTTDAQSTYIKKIKTLHCKNIVKVLRNLILIKRTLSTILPLEIAQIIAQESIKDPNDTFAELQIHCSLANKLNTKR